MAVGVSVPERLPANSRKLAWDSKLRALARYQSIYTDLVGEYSSDKKSLPNAITVTINDKNSWSYTMTMVLPLVGEGTHTGYLIGNEEALRTVTAKCYREDCRHAVPTQTEGAEFLETDYYQLYPMAQPLLSNWNKDREDLEYHQAAQEQFGETLYHNSTEDVCITNLQRNIFIPGLELQNASPTYSSNPATYTQNVIEKIVEAGNGSLAPTASQVPNTVNLTNFQHFLINRKVEQLDIPGLPGGKGWFLVVGNVMAGYMKETSWSSNNLGKLWKDTTSMNDKLLKYYGVIGQYGKFVVVEDVRQCTLLPGGTSEYSATTGYMFPGDNDQRNLDQPNVRDCVFALGKAAFYRWTPQPLRFTDQEDDYKRFKGIGTTVVRGIGSILWDQQTPTSSSCRNYGIAVMYCGFPDMIA
jgi:hypothetical protein